MKLKNKELGHNFKEAISSQITATITILFILLISLSIINPLFIKWNNLNIILRQVAPIGILSLGAMCIIITGGIDLSAGNGVAFAGSLAGVLYFRAAENLPVLITVSIVGGIMLGILNGLFITRFNLVPFIVTLATMAIAQGLTLFVSEGRVAFLNHPGTFIIGAGQLFNVIPVPFLIFLLMCLITWILLNHTKMGIYIYALGGNEEAARFSGININKYKFLVYLYGGFCTGVAALLTVCRIGQIAPNMAGTPMLLDGIAAAIIGGTSVQGGKGTVIGTLLGVLVIGVISNALIFLNLTTVAQEAVKGLVIIIALIIDSLFAKLKFNK